MGRHKVKRKGRRKRQAKQAMKSWASNIGPPIRMPWSVAELTTGKVESKDIAQFLLIQLDALEKENSAAAGKFLMRYPKANIRKFPADSANGRDLLVCAYMEFLQGYCLSFCAPEAKSTAATTLPRRRNICDNRATKIVGDRVTLIPYTEEHVRLTHKWLDDGQCSHPNIL